METNNTLDWEAIHAAFDLRDTGKTTAHKLAGADVPYWADLYSKNNHRLKRLTTSIILDQRINSYLTQEQDKWFRMGVKSLELAMLACVNEEKRQNIESSNKAKKKKHNFIP